MINPKLTKLPLDEPQTQTFQKSERELKGKYGRLYLPAENQEFLYKQPNLLFQLWDSLRSSAEYTVFILQTGPGTAEYLSACNDVWIHARRVFIASVELLVVLSNDVNKRGNEHYLKPYQESLAKRRARCGAVPVLPALGGRWVTPGDMLFLWREGWASGSMLGCPGTLPGGCRSGCCGCSQGLRRTCHN